jgi:hypothetical protein
MPRWRVFNTEPGDFGPFTLDFVGKLQGKRRLFRSASGEQVVLSPRYSGEDIDRILQEGGVVYAAFLKPGSRVDVSEELDLKDVHTWGYGQIGVVGD